ncbi:MAG TPA: hypothetical protein VIE86_02605 [Nitrososphaera sp.]|jgi:hypothetical protein
MDAREGILYESITDALQTLGDSTRQAFIWQLKKNGIRFTPHRVDLREIELMLLQYFGDGAHGIFDRICESFTRKGLDRGYFRVVPDSKEQAVVAKAVERFLHGGSFDKTAD